MTDIEMLKKLTGESDEELLSLLLSEATEFVLAYTNRTGVPAVLQRTVRELATITYNRLGTEGEAGRSEGGESYSFDAAPKQVYDVLDRYRLAGIGGRRYEAKKEPAEHVQSPAGNSQER